MPQGIVLDTIDRDGSVLYDDVSTMRAVIAFLLSSFALTVVVPVVAEEVYQVGGDVTSPKLIHKAEPKYTKRAKKEKSKGTVSLAAVVNKQGIPESIEVVKGLNSDLDAEAVKAVSQWRFEPAQKNGEPVAVKVKIEVNFRLCCRLF